jgi:opacity protein-like surface antigen
MKNQRKPAFSSPVRIRLSPLPMQLRSPRMKIFRRLHLLLAVLILVSPAWAASIKDEVESVGDDKAEEVSRDLFEIKSSYVFESDLHRGGSFGDQYALSNSFSYGHRFLISGHLYLNLGISYDRFDFGATGAPVPEHLQGVAGNIGFEYMHNNDIGAFFQVKPGFYTEDDFDSASFDAPITLGRIFVLQPDKLYVFVGANASFLRGQFPVIPLAGVIWMPTDKLRFLALLPEPRFIYSPGNKWDFWAGGQLIGGSFRTDRDKTIVPSKLSNAQVDYSEYRVGGGVIYSPSDAVTIDFGVGYALQRKFEFYRADMTFKTDGAPYLRLELSAKF